ALWDDQERAQHVMKSVAHLETMLQTWQDLEQRSQDVQALLELASEAGDEERAELVADLGRDLAALEREYDALEVTLTLSGPYDSRNAVLSIHAGAGGTEAQDWAEMLLRMYTRWAESRGFSTEVLFISSGDEAGIK